MDSLMKHVQYIDDIRRDKKMTVKSLCDGIINERTYRRYLSGERNISQDKLIMFCQRLGISPETFFDSFRSRDSNEFTRLYKIYGHLRDKKYDDFKRDFGNVDRKSLYSSMNQKFYDYLEIRYPLDIKKVSKKVTYKKYSKLVGFPECEEHSVFDFVDIVILFGLSNIESNTGDMGYRATSLLKRIMSDESIRYINAEGKYMLFAIYSALAVAYNTMGDWEEALNMSEKGIDYALKYSNNSNLTNLYFVKAKALLMLGRKEEAYDEAAKSLSNTLVLQNYGHLKIFTRLSRKYFDLEPEELIKILVDKHKDE